LVGWRLLGVVSLSSEERGTTAGDAGGLAFLFPFEERRDIRVAGSDWRKFRCKGMEREGELIPILNANTQLIYWEPDIKSINLV